MPDQDPKISELEARLDALIQAQTDFHKEVSLIKGELVRLRARSIMASQEGTKPSLYAPLRPTDPTLPGKQNPQPPVQDPPVPSEQQAPRPQSGTPRPSSPAPASSPRPPVRPQAPADPAYTLPKRTAYEPDPVLSSATVSSDAFSRFVAQYTEKGRENLEKFIGENLISLIGIIVLILGVGIGAKYAIDNNLISPLTRIIVGYVFGFGLVGLAIYIRRKYESFSAVLISGGMAIMYFLTYFAYSPYALISQLGAFGLMVMFTIFTVTAALVYSRQVIAHVGLVGAYAVPFLLSNDSGNYLALFIYMTVINIGILAVSLRKRWVPIFYTSSVFTWAIFCGWFFTKYSPQEHFTLALTFLGIFFAILYGTKIAQTQLLKENDNSLENLVSSTLTAAIFFGMCFGVVLKGSLEPVQYWILFSYLGVAMAAIIGASLKFYKHAFGFYTASAFTWAIFAGWFATTYSYQQYFELALTFLGVFLAISYATTLVQTRLVQDDDDRTGNIIAAVLTGAVFYAFCYALMIDPLIESPRYWTLFSYIAAFSILLLATSFKFFGRVFMYLVVPCAWVIYGVWFISRYDASEHFAVATVFVALFFAIFYSSVLFHRLVDDNFSLVQHTSLMLSNAFVFYGFGYAILDSREALSGYLGLYTAANAVLHLAISLFVRSIKPNAIDVVQVLTLLVLTFASIAVPVQFDGNVVTMVWAAEAAVLFWYGRTRAVRLFEYCAYPVMFLAAVSMFLDWAVSYGDRMSGLGPVSPVFNSDFITAAVFVAAFALIYITNRNDRYEPAIDKNLTRLVGYVIATTGSFVLYNMFRREIGNYFYIQSVPLGSDGSMTRVRAEGDLQVFNVLAQIDYSILFLIAMSGFNLKKFRSSSLAFVNSGLSILALGAFATISMFLFYVLRESYMSDSFEGPAFIAPIMHIAIRPISYLFAFGLIYLLYEYSRDELMTGRLSERSLSLFFETIAYTFTFIVASCELLNLMGQLHIPDGTKLGLSILWGVYALSLIVIGIARDKKHLRIVAFVLLAVTLAKLFLYDIADLDTIPKTILFVTLGITLLVVSFLYNKYTAVMFKTDAAQED